MAHGKGRLSVCRGYRAAAAVDRAKGRTTAREPGTEGGSFATATAWATTYFWKAPVAPEGRSVSGLREQWLESS